jgi:hypothetical protein
MQNFSVQIRVQEILRIGFFIPVTRTGQLGRTAPRFREVGVIKNYRDLNGANIFDLCLTRLGSNGWLPVEYTSEFRAMLVGMFFECPTDFSFGSVQAGTGNPT